MAGTLSSMPMAAEHTQQLQRNGLHAAMHLSCKLAAECNWSQVMSGTALHLDDFDQEIDPDASVRRNALHIKPRALLVVALMQEQLQRYFTVERDTFSDAEVTKFLALCAGTR